jgi:type II secretory pathway component PulF
MATFKYTAVAPDSGPIEGSVEADSVAAARQLLAERGLEKIQILVTEGSMSDVRLSRAEQAQFVGHVGDIVRAEIPLSVGLRALAEEVPNKRISAAFMAMSQDLDSGLALDVAFANQASSLPSYLSGLVRAGRKSGSLARSFGQYTEFIRLRDKMRRNLQSSLLYPLAVAVICLALLGGLLGFIVPMFRSIFQSFGTELPGLTQVLINVSAVVESILQWWPISLAVVVVFVVNLPRILRAVQLSEFCSSVLYSIPIFGTMLSNRAHAEFSQLLAMMVENDVPLPTALRLAGEGIEDGYLRAAANRMSQCVQQGLSLVEAARYQHRLSPSFVQALVCGRQDGMLPSSLRSVSEHFAAQTLVDSRMVGLGLEPLIILGMGGSVGLLVIALFMPLVKLLNDLS